MASSSIDIDAPPEDVWRVLADAHAYADWVVGTKAVPTADAAWPEVGAALAYEAGAGPATVSDRTVVVECVPRSVLVLRAELRPVGGALVRLTLEPADGGTRVVMDEEPEGIVGAAHNRISDAALAARNDLALRRLKQLVGDAV